MNYKYCPYCSHKYSTSEPYHFHCDNCGKDVYLNSKPTASALIINTEGKILLGKRAIDPSKGMWDIIGGFLNYGENPESGVLREVKEETGLDVEITAYLGAFMDTYGVDQDATLNLCFITRPIGGKEAPDDDIAELMWVSPDEIPAEIAFENGSRMIEAWKRSGL